MYIYTIFLDLKFFKINKHMFRQSRIKEERNIVNNFKRCSQKVRWIYICLPYIYTLYTKV